MAEESLRQEIEILQRQLAEAEARALRAEEADRRKTRFISLMSHELRTPLNAMNGFVDLMIAGYDGQLQPQQKDTLQLVKGNVVRVRELVDAVLNIAKIEAGRFELEITTFEPVEFVRGLMAELSGMVVEKGLDFSLEIEGTMRASVQGDVTYVRRVVQNLISNGVKFTDTGYVKVRLGMPEQGWWSIAVEDSGVGIPEEALSYIFEPFRRVVAEGRQKVPGTGLGLSIVQGLVKLMGGTIAVRSEEGKGSVFVVSLPIVISGDGQKEVTHGRTVAV